MRVSPFRRGRVGRFTAELSNLGCLSHPKRADYYRMIRAVLLIFEPVATWEKLFRTRPGVGAVFGISFFPLLLAVAALEGYGIKRWGSWQTELERMKTFPQNEAVVVAVVHLLLMTLVCFLATKVIKSMADTFHARQTYDQAFVTVACSMLPLLLFSLLNVFPFVSPWATWSVGIAFTVRALYHGIPRMMDPDPIHAFGLFIGSALVIAFATSLVRFFIYYYVRGSSPLLTDLVYKLCSKLHF